MDVSPNLVSFIAGFILNEDIATAIDAVVFETIAISPVTAVTIASVKLAACSPTPHSQPFTVTPHCQTIATPTAARVHTVAGFTLQIIVLGVLGVGVVGAGGGRSCGCGTALRRVQEERSW